MLVVTTFVIIVVVIAKTVAVAIILVAEVLTALTEATLFTAPDENRQTHCTSQ